MKNIWKKLFVLGLSISLTFSTVTVYAEGVEENVEQTIADTTEETIQEETEDEEKIEEDSAVEPELEEELSANPQNNETVEADEQKEVQQNAGEKSSIWRLSVGGVNLVSDYTVTGETYPGVSFDHVNNILTLNNANIEMEPVDSRTGDIEEIIYVANMSDSDAGLTINLEGNNYLSYTRDLNNNAFEFSSAVISLGCGDVVFSGDGVLNIKAAKGVDNGILSNGGGGNLIIDGDVKINITPSAVESPFGFAGVYINQGFTMKSGELNILGNVPGYVPGTFAGIYANPYSEAGINVLGGKVNIQGPDCPSTYTTQYGIDSQRGDLKFKNTDVKIHLGKSMGTTFALLCGNYDESNNQLVIYPSKLIVEDSYIECRTKDQGNSYSAYFFDFGEKENLHFYVGESVASREVSFDEAFEYGGHTADVAKRYECSYKCFTISSNPVDIQVVPGDINGDTIIDLADLMLCLHHVSGSEVLDGDALLAADVDSDGEVNLIDLMRILHYVSGSSTEL